MDVFELSAKLRLDSSEYENSLKNLGKGGGLDKLNSGINKVLGIGAMAAGAAAAGMVAFSKASVQTGMQFDSAMSQVAATMGTTVDQIGELRDFAQEMGSKTAFSATQAAEALNYMALAGYDADTSMAMLPNVLNLAAAGSMDLARASDMVTDAQTALGLTTEETSTMVDQMAAAASKSNTSVSQLGDAMLTIGATARNLKGGTQELATVLGVLADNGIKGAEGGTHLRNAILSLQTPTKDGTEALAKLGMTYEDMYDSAGNMRSLPEIFQQMSTAMQGMNQQAKDAIISGIFNKTDLASINALVGTSAERWTELGAAITASAGAAEQMANTQLDNLAGDVTLMKSAFEGVKIAVSDGLTPAIRNVVQQITKVLSNKDVQTYIANLAKRVGELASTLTGKIANAVPRLVNIFTKAAPVIKAAGVAFAGFAIAVKATINPVGALVTALGVMAGAFALSELTADSATKKFSGLTDEQYRNVEATLDSIEAYDDMRKSREQSYNAIDKEADKTRDLWNELQTLVDENGRVTEGNEKHAQSLVELLNSLGVEIELTDGQISNYNELAESIDNVIKKKQAMAKLEVAEEGYKNAQKELSTVSDAIYDVESEIATAQTTVDGFRTKLQELLTADMSDATVAANVQWEVEQTNAALRQAESALQTRQAQREDLRAHERDLYNDIGTYEKALVELTNENYDAVNDILDRNSQSRMRHLVETGNITAEELSVLTRNADKLMSETERYAEELNAGAEGRTQEGLEKLQAQSLEAIQLLAEAKEQIQTEGSETGEGYVDALGEADASGAAQDVTSGASSVLQRFVSDASRLGGEAGRAWTSAFEANAVARTPSVSGGGFGAAIGIDYVPYNSFPASLHKGEAVLTRQEAEEWRRDERGGGNTIAINQYLETVPQTPVELAAATLAMFEQARWSVA